MNPGTVFNLFAKYAVTRKKVIVKLKHYLIHCFILLNKQENDKKFWSTPINIYVYLSTQLLFVSERIRRKNVRPCVKMKNKEEFNLSRRKKHAKNYILIVSFKKMQSCIR